MCVHMTRQEFDRAVIAIAEEEFGPAIDRGLLELEMVRQNAQRMADSLHEHFPDMTDQESEWHLRLLRKECHKTADQIFEALRKAYGE